MKTTIWLMKTELKQNRSHFFLVAAISILLGVSISLAVTANRRIAAMAQGTDWQADLVVVPKGVSLNDFEHELLSGRTYAFLPEALFDTTVSLAKEGFSITALLALTDSSGPQVMAKSHRSEIGTSWLKSHIRVKPWAEQRTYETPEWGNKLMAGFVASGPLATMESLKQLIDRKTVAQAIFIQEQQVRDAKNQSELKSGLFIYTGVLLVLIFLALVSLFFWVRVRLANTLAVLDEAGFADRAKFALIMALVFAVSGLPLMLGLWLGPGLSPVS